MLSIGGVENAVGQCSETTPDELSVAAAPRSLPETDHDGNDTETNEDDPHYEKRPSALRRTASSAHP